MYNTPLNNIRKRNKEETLKPSSICWFGIQIKLEIFVQQWCGPQGLIAVTGLQ